MANVLKVENVTMQFGGLLAVDNVNLSVDEGEIVAMIGPNGAGKTTVFNVITGVYQPTNGAVYFCGKEIIENFPRGKMKKQYMGQHSGDYNGTISPTPDQITKLGMARTFQNIRLWKSLSVFENVLIAMHCRTHTNFLAATFRFNQSEELGQRNRAYELLQTVGLEDVCDETASSLPYGMQRRLEIARALATNPRLLLLDEPAAGMNPRETEELTAFISDIRSRFQLTVFLIEHHMDLVMDISDRIYVLDFGKLIAEGNSEEIQTNQKVIDAYLGVEGTNEGGAMDA